MAKRIPVEIRFAKYIAIDPETECWNWTGGIFKTGYGAMAIDGKLLKAHRVSHALHHGPIPDGLRVLHKCDNRRCVNPNHLFLGTNTDNMRDMVNKGRALNGEKNPNSKLTVEQVRAIRKDPRQLRDIAKDYGIHFSGVGYIKRKITWKHVTEEII